MKFIALLGFAINAFAWAPPAKPVLPYDLMKCTSAKFGTVWASFGRVMTSDDPEARYFLTEVVVIDPQERMSRLHFWGPKEADAAGTAVRVRPGSMAAEFAFADGPKHKITLINNIKNDPYSFMGNWETTQADGSSSADLVSCTAR